MARQQPQDVDALIARAAREAEIDPGLYSRLIKQGERSWKGWQASPMGAFGPAQLMPGTAAALASKYKLDPQDYYGNLLAGAHYLREQLSTFKGNRRLAVAAYNAGPGNVQKYGGVPPFQETQRYVENIFKGWKPGTTTTTTTTPATTPAATTPARAPGAAPAPPTKGAFNWDFALQSMAAGGSPMEALGAMTGVSIPSLTAPSPLGTSSYAQQPKPWFLPAVKAPKVAAPAATPGRPATPAATPAPTPGKAPKAQGTLHEAFYDPLGGYDEGTEIGAIGGHSDHVHFSFGSRAQAVAIMREAQRRGMSVRENPFTENVDPVHTTGSFHYRNFGGKVNGKQVGMGADISGTPQQMADIYKWAKSRYT